MSNSEKTYIAKIIGFKNWDKISELIKDRIADNGGVFTEDCLKNLPLELEVEPIVQSGQDP